MNYEVFYLEMQRLSTDLGDIIGNQSKAYKSLGKNMESGNLKNVGHEVLKLQNLGCDYQVSLQKMQEHLASFDPKQYLENGDFVQQMIECCQEKGVDITGHFPLYDVFPCKIKIDVENSELYLDGRKTLCLRPSGFVDAISLTREKLIGTTFNPMQFASELSWAYDATLLKQNIGKSSAPDTDCYLESIYKTLTPMRQFKQNYTMQNFSFDLARLYNSSIDAIKDGRKIQFGPSRNMKQAFRILDNNGNEQFLATIRFYRS